MMSARDEEYQGMLQAVWNCLLHGKDLAASRTWISSHTGLNDRTARKVIEALRNSGVLICNDQDGMGYYIAETDEEILRQYRRDCARAMSILKRLKAFRAAVREIEQQEENKDQVTIEEILMLVGDKI